MAMPPPRRQLLSSTTLRHSAVAVVDQGLNSATNFVVGALLVRGVGTAEYGLYVLANTALLLAAGLQNSLIAAPMSVLAPKRDAARRARFVGALAVTQFAVWVPLFGVCLAAIVLAGALGVVGVPLRRLAVATALSAFTVVGREFLRQALFVFARPLAVLAVDAVFSAIFLGGVVAGAAALGVDGGEQSATGAIGAMGIAGACAVAVGTWILTSRAGAVLAWDRESLRDVRRPAKWGVLGMLVSWAQNQGFLSLLGHLRGTTAVGAVAASRMLMMPIGIVLTAVGAILRPRGAEWLARGESGLLQRRVLALTGATAALTVAYTAVVWAARGWILEHIFRKVIPEVDALLLLWGLVFLVQVFRENLMILLQVFERFEVLFWLALIGAAAALATAWAGIRWYGAAGSLAGLVVGEALYLAGIAISLRARGDESRRARGDAGGDSSGDR